MGWVWFALFMALGVGLSLLDKQWGFDTALLEGVHATVLTGLLMGCCVAHVRYPSIRQFGWYRIVAGMALLTLGSWADILDQYPITIVGIPMGHTWQQAFIEKILGYSAGIGLVGLGFFQWVPWMLHTRERVEALNQRLTHTLTSLDERVEAERLTLSRELHDDIAQRLTALGYQVQLAEAQSNDPSAVAKIMRDMGKELSDSLKTVRSLCRNLRPESLFALGLIPALEQWLAKTCPQYPQVEVVFSASVLPGLDTRLGEERQLHLYRMVQESIRNALKHSGANRLLIAIAETPEQLTATLTDNGNGLPWDEAPTSDALVEAGHLGVAGLRERADSIGAQYTLANTTRHTSLDAEATPKGVQVIVTLPWPSGEPSASSSSLPSYYSPVPTVTE